ncbi:MAG: DUF2461 family protein [Planctomycetota bacterium]
MSFEGFPDRTFRFLRALAQDNSRATFAALRDDYEAHYVGAGRAFVESVALGLAKVAPGLTADPRIDGSIVRLHRDARFVRDRPPYKEQLELWFWEGERARAVSLLSLTVAPGGARIGVGARGLRGDALAAYRAALSDPGARRDLERLVGSACRAGFDLAPRTAARRAVGKGPQRGTLGGTLGGTAADGAASLTALQAGLARRRDLVATLDVPRRLARSAELAPRCLAVWRRLLPLHRWFVEHVQHG